MSAKWEKFESFEKQIKPAEDGVTLKLKDGREVKYDRGVVDGSIFAADVTHVLAHRPLPHAEMRAEHARTGREVEKYDGIECQWFDDLRPDWIPFDRYRFKEPRREKVYYREFFYRYEGKIFIGVVNKDSPGLTEVGAEKMQGFVEWRHSGWKESIICV